MFLPRKEINTGVGIVVALQHDLGKPDSPDPIEKFSSRPDFQALIYPGKSHLTASASGPSGRGNRIKNGRCTSFRSCGTTASSSRTLR